MSSFQSLKNARTARQKNSSSSINRTDISTADVSAPASTASDIEVTKTTVQPKPTSSSNQEKPELSVQPTTTHPNENDNDENTQYSTQLKGLIIRTTKQSGRGIYAQKPFKAGTSLLKPVPAVSALSTGELPNYCSSCFLSPHELSVGGSRHALKRCTGCQVVHYCSTVRSSRRIQLLIYSHPLIFCICLYKGLLSHGIYCNDELILFIRNARTSIGQTINPNVKR